MGAFTKAKAVELFQLIEMLQRREEAELFGLVRPTTPFVACPDNIGNDPCDDANPYDDEDW